MHIHKTNKKLKKNSGKYITYKYICRKKTSRIIFKIQARKHFTTTFAKHLLIILMLKIWVFFMSIKLSKQNLLTKLFTMKKVHPY